jgi:hypothetical protein
MLRPDARDMQPLCPPPWPFGNSGPPWPDLACACLLMMADQDRQPGWDDIQNLMSAIHAAFGPLGGIVSVLPMPFRPLFAALYLGLHDLSETLFLAYLSAVCGQNVQQLDPVGTLLGIPDSLPCFAFIITIKGVIDMVCLR